MNGYNVRRTHASLDSVLVLHANMLPLFVARLNNLVQHCSPRGIRVVGVELTESCRCEDWLDKMRGAQPGWKREAHFDLYTLVPGRALETVDHSLLWKRFQRLVERERPQVVLFGPLPSSRGMLRWLERQGTATIVLSDQLSCALPINYVFNRQRYRWGFRGLRYLAYPAHRYQEWRKRSIVKGFDAAIVPSPAHVDYIVSLGVSRERVFVGYWVVDNDAFALTANKYRRDREHWRKQWGLPEKYFLVVARLIPKKNLRRLFEAYQQYRENSLPHPWGLVVCGTGPGEGALRNLISSERIDGIILAGYKQPEVLAGYYGLASALVFPGWGEPWGLAVNEAMACGLPVLGSSHIGAATALIAEGINGWSIDPFSIENMSSAFSRMSTLTDADREQMGNSSAEIIKHWGLDRFSLTVVAAAEAVHARRQRGYLRGDGSQILPYPLL